MIALITHVCLRSRAATWWITLICCWLVWMWLAVILLGIGHAEARAHCRKGQIYRVSMGVCQGRASARAQLHTGRHTARAERRAARQAARAERQAARAERKLSLRRNPKLQYVRVVEPEPEYGVSPEPCGREVTPLALIPLYDLPTSTVLHPPKARFERL